MECDFHVPVYYRVSETDIEKYLDRCLQCVALSLA